MHAKPFAAPADLRGPSLVFRDCLYASEHLFALQLYAHMYAEMPHPGLR